jgi:hypothetical protein
VQLVQLQHQKHLLRMRLSALAPQQPSPEYWACPMLLDLQNHSLMAPGRVHPLEVTSVTSVACSSAPGQVLAACSVILLFWLPLLQPAAPPVALLLLLVLLLLLGSSHPRRFACSWPAQPLVPLLGSLLRSLLQWAAPQKVFLVAAAAQSPPGPPGG